MTEPEFTAWLSARWVDPRPHMRTVEPELWTLAVIVVLVGTVLLTVLSATRP